MNETVVCLTCLKTIVKGIVYPVANNGYVCNDCALEIEKADGIKVDVKRPMRIRMLQTVYADFPFFDRRSGTVAWLGREYEVHVNPFGAVSAILENGKALGLKPGEFEVIAWDT